MTSISLRESDAIFGRDHVRNSTARATKSSKRITATLWTVQALLAGLTPLAAGGLVIIMIGATVLTVAINGGAPALMPLVVGLLAVFVAYGRWRLAPIS